MSAKIEDLIPEFQAKANQLLANCRARGVEMRPVFTVRTPFEQAKLWRQSRTGEQVRAKVAEFRQKGAPFLAFCIEDVGPSSGPKVTNAPPGLSWHQFGESMDCVWIVNGKEVWDTARKVNGVNGFQVYAEEAKKMGLNAGLFWNSFQDPPHVQLRAESNPAKVFSLQQIDQIMRERFAPANFTVPVATPQPAG